MNSVKIISAPDGTSVTLSSSPNDPLKTERKIKPLLRSSEQPPPFVSRTRSQSDIFRGKCITTFYETYFTDASLDPGPQTSRPYYTSSKENSESDSEREESHQEPLKRGATSPRSIEPKVIITNNFSYQQTTDTVVAIGSPKVGWGSSTSPRERASKSFSIDGISASTFTRETFSDPMARTLAPLRKPFSSSETKTNFSRSQPVHNVSGSALKKAILQGYSKDAPKKASKEKESKDKFGSLRRKKMDQKITTVDVLEIIGTGSFKDRAADKGINPVHSLMSDMIGESELATVLERQSPEVRRQYVKEMASLLKRMTNLLDFSTALATELDVQKAMDMITAQVCDVLRADRATLFLVDEQANELWAQPKLKGFGELKIPIGKGIASHVAITGEVVNVANAYMTASFFPEIDQLTGYHTKSVLCMPVKDQYGRIVAVLQALNKFGGSFTDDDEIAMKTLCMQTANCLRNSQIYSSGMITQQRVEALLEVATQLSSELETTSLITVIMQKAKQLLDAERCTLFLVDNETEELWSKVADGTQEIRVPLKAGIAGHVATTGETLNIPDAYNDKRFNREVDLKTGFRTRTILCMPLRNREGEIIGVTQILNKRDGVFDKEDEDLLHAFSAQAGIALENAKLFQKTLEMRNYLQSILKSITNLVLTLDEYGKFLTSNRSVETLTGISEEIMKVYPFQEWLGPENKMFAEDIEKVYTNPVEIQCNDYEYIKEVDNVTSVVSIKYTVVPLLDFRHTQIGVVIIIEDITPQKKMMSTLSRYMSPSLAEQVIKEGGDRLGGVHVTVTTLFIDIRDFTKISEVMDASDVVDMLNEYFSFMVTCIFEEDGVLDKYIGDAAMAVFGVPFSKSDDAARACRAALKMLIQLKKFNAHREAKGAQPINVGIGINTGKVLSGNIGSEKRLEYTVIGDGVNVASRIEGATKQYGLKTLISEHTLKDIQQHSFICREIDSIRVLGKKQPIRIYELLGQSPEDVDPALLSCLPVFAQALTAYRSRDFFGAKKLFQHCINVAEDSPSRLYFTRCTEFLKNPPPPDWDQVWELNSK